MKLHATILLIFLLAAQVKAQAPVTVVGDYVEARSGHVYTCGCLYSGEMVTGGKEAILIWRIASGEYKGTPLVGIKVAAVVVGDANLGTEATSRHTVLYLDRVTSSAQKEAVLALWQREYSRVLGEITAVHSGPISFERQGETMSVSLPGIARLLVRKARLPEDAHPGSSLWYAPFAPLSESALGTALQYEYWGIDFQRQWREMVPSISGYIGKFAFPVEM